MTAFRPSFPHLETLKKILEKLNSLSLTVRKKKKEKKIDRPTDPIFKFGSGEGNITIFFLALQAVVELVAPPPPQIKRRNWEGHLTLFRPKFSQDILDPFMSSGGLVAQKWRLFLPHNSTPSPEDSWIYMPLITK